MSSSLDCWSCGEALLGLSLPLGRQDQCSICSNYLHVCRMCSYFDPLVSEACLEDDAEAVKEKTRPNFCDYFKPSVNAFDPKSAAVAKKAEAELAALFGNDFDESKGESEKSNLTDGSNLSAADELFSKD